MLVFALLNGALVGAAPFVTTWNTSQANKTIQLPTLSLRSNVTIDWGDSTTSTTFLANSSANPSHIYASAGLYNVSVEGQFRWTWQGSPTKPNLVDIVSWGDGFLVDAGSIQMFQGYPNLRVSAPPNTQPVFLPGSNLTKMFGFTSFNSSLDWDLTNVTKLDFMFWYTPLNQPINFRNTQNVTSIDHMFQGSQFNQPFHFDATNLLSASDMFSWSEAFNQVVNLTNSNKLTNLNSMFYGASSFNQPITFNLDSVTEMADMFANAISFNQPFNFPSTSKLTATNSMFMNATSFNQPVTLNTSNVSLMMHMFHNASSFSSPVNFTSTSAVVDMWRMFEGVEGFYQDLSSWNVSQVAGCAKFCPRCGLPNFTSCVPCNPIYTNNGQQSCTNDTRAPSTSAPSRTPSTSAPSRAPPSEAPSDAPSPSAVSAAHAEGIEIIMLVGLAFVV